MGRGKTGNFWKAAAILLGCALLTGCGNTGEVDDYATNIGYEARGSNGTTQVVQSESGSSATTQTAGIPKEEIKVGVLHLSDPAEGSGYTYTHDLGIQGMQQNLGLSDDQIVRKINVNDGDAQGDQTGHSGMYRRWLQHHLHHQLGIYGDYGGDGGRISGRVLLPRHGLL